MKERKKVLDENLLANKPLSRRVGLTLKTLLVLASWSNAWYKVCSRMKTCDGSRVELQLRKQKSTGK
jgi:hypothetical protein